MHSLFFYMDALIEFLSQFTTERRFQLYKDVAANRTRYVTPVLEDLYQAQNASAVLRTCECLGLQDIHVVEQRNKFQLSPDVELGAAQWLTLHKYNKPSDDNITLAIKNLRAQGYRIVATSPHTKEVSLDDFDLSKGKVALLFGTELKGLTESALSQADEFVTIPMSGFTESFNISVSVAITANTLVKELRNSYLPWKFTETEQKQLILDWLRKSIKNSDLLEKRFNFGK